MGGNMDYNELLNNIYTQFNENNKYEFNKNIQFFKESNTNIVNFEINDANFGVIQGTIINQCNSVLIYFHVRDNIILSKANIDTKNMAYITNVLLNKGDIKMIEIIKRKFEKRKDLYKASSYDNFVNNGELDSEFTYLISNIIEKYNQKSIQKRHKI